MIIFRQDNQGDILLVIAFQWLNLLIAILNVIPSTELCALLKLQMLSVIAI